MTHLQRHTSAAMMHAGEAIAALAQAQGREMMGNVDHADILRATAEAEIALRNALECCRVAKAGL
jgi:hypothetical protein